MFGKKRKEEVDSTRARIRDLTSAIAEKRKPSASTPPARKPELKEEDEQAEQFTPNGSRRVIGFDTSRR